MFRLYCMLCIWSVYAGCELSWKGKAPWYVPCGDRGFIYSYIEHMSTQGICSVERFWMQKKTLALQKCRHVGTNNKLKLEKGVKNTCEKKINVSNGNKHISWIYRLTCDNRANNLQQFLHTQALTTFGLHI